MKTAMRTRTKVNLTLCAFLHAALLMTAQARQQPRIRVTVHDEAGKPLAAAQAQLKLRDATVGTATTDEEGVATFTLDMPGSYEVTVSKTGFETLTRSAVEVPSGALVEVAFTAVPAIALKESVEVSARQESPVEQGASPPTQLQRAQVKSLPNRPATVADTLPLTPGVTREPDGGIAISGSGEHRSALVVNAVDVTDPATGQFGMTIPVDSVETIDVFQTPYLVQYGRFTAGVVSVETRRGGEKWNFELNDPLPEFRYRSKHLRGLKDATPRVIFNGPLRAQRLYISQGTEYAITKEPVRTLGFPYNESKRESVNSFTQFDYIVATEHTLTQTMHVAPRHTNFVNLNFFNPQPVTPSFGARDYTSTTIDRLSLGKVLLESSVAIKRSGVRVWGQGLNEMTMTPTGNRGNYFSSQNRHVSRLEWLENLSVERNGHHFKFGLALTRTANRGGFLARPINIVDAVGRRLRRIEFAGVDRFNLHDFETALFSQDHFVISPKLAFDFGVRVEKQDITETARIAPRAGFAWTPAGPNRTVVRGGIGFFYDRVPLNVYAFGRYPQRLITTYAADGGVTDGPRRVANITERAERRKFPFIHSGHHVGDFAPYSATWNIEVEHPLTSFLKVRANYLNGDSYGVVIITPKIDSGQEALSLGGGGRARYRQLELTARLSWKDASQLFFSYVRSRALSDLNEFNQYLGNFPSPIVRQNRYTNLPADLPNRFLSWGVIKLPRQMEIAPVVEWRSGFPYSLTDVMQNYVGLPNKQRFPNFFSFDARIAKDFKVNKDYSVRFALSGFNLTNHFNALDVHANTADPQYGIFFGNHKRRYRVDFDVLF
jgi:hypothetical protein